MLRAYTALLLHDNIPVGKAEYDPARDEASKIG